MHAGSGRKTPRQDPLYMDGRRDTNRIDLLGCPHTLPQANGAPWTPWRERGERGSCPHTLPAPFGGGRGFNRPPPPMPGNQPSTHAGVGSVLTGRAVHKGTASRRTPRAGGLSDHPGAQRIPTRGGRGGGGGDTLGVRATGARGAGGSFFKIPLGGAGGEGKSGGESVGAGAGDGKRREKGPSGRGRGEGERRGEGGGEVT